MAHAQPSARSNSIQEAIHILAPQAGNAGTAAGETATE